MKKKYKRYLNMLQKARFYMMKDGHARANFLRKKGILREIGENVYFHSRIMPPDPKLLKIGNNVSIAANVRFLGHDRIDIVLTGMYGKKYTKFYDCIEVGDNVFIGSDVVILPGVRIEDNTIIGAGAVVTKDLPSGYVWGGVPAAKIGTFQDLIDKRKDTPKPLKDPDKLWDRFAQERTP